MPLLLGMNGAAGKHINTTWISQQNAGSNYFWDPIISSDLSTVFGSDSNNSIFTIDYSGKFVKNLRFTSPTYTTYTCTTTNKLNSNGDYYVYAKNSAGSNTTIIKLNNANSIVWQKKINTIYSDYVNVINMQSDSSGNLYCLGLSSAGAAYKYFSITKIDSSGNILWAKELSWGSAPDISSTYSIVTDNSGNTSFIYNSTTTALRTYLVRYDTNGNLLWSRRLSAPTSYSPYLQGRNAQCVVDNSGNTFVIIQARYTGVPPAGQYGIESLMKFDSSGNLVWQKVYSNTSDDLSAVCITLDNSGNIYTAFFSPTAGIYLNKWNSSGTIIWNNYILYSGSVATANYLNVPGNLDFNEYTQTINVSGYFSTVSKSSMIRVPADGSKLGTYIQGSYNYTYSAGPAINYPAVSFQSENLSPTITASPTYSLGAGDCVITSIALPSFDVVTIN